MAATKTPDVRLNTAKELRHAADWRLKFETGTIAMDAEYATGGESVSFPGFKSVVAVVLQPRGGYVFDYVSSKVKAYMCNSQVAMQEVASSTDLSALSDIPYIAFGF